MGFTTHDQGLLGWVEKLTGLVPERVNDALGRITSWRISHLDRQLLQNPCVDTAVAITLLAEAIQKLCAGGVPEEKLLAKLRRDPDVWPTWAELRAATLLLTVLESGGMFHMEPDRRKGKHADFRLISKDGEPHSIEFKAIGLSDEEADFCRRVAPALYALVPPLGLLTLHSRLDLPQVPLHRCDLKSMHANALQATTVIPNFPEGLSALEIVGHGGEANYLRRVCLRLQKEATQQIAASESGWAAFYWTNGAPISSVLAHLRWEDLPERLVGLIFLGGAVAFPDANIHSYRHILPRGADPTLSPLTFSPSKYDLGRLVFERFQASSGVRATLLAGGELGEQTELLRRDGRRRILPFNLLLDRDPPDPLSGLPKSPGAGVLR